MSPPASQSVRATAGVSVGAAMAALADLAAPKAYCRGCGYDLREQAAAPGAGERRCPECGRAFDPADARTFLRRPRRVVLRRLVFWLTPPLMLLLGVSALAGWVYRGWAAEQPARRVLAQWLPYYKAQTRSILPAPVEKAVGTRLATYGERVVVYTSQCGRPAPDEELDALASLRHLESLRLYYRGLSDDRFARLGELAELRELNLTGNHLLTDATVERIAALRHLRALRLDLTGISDRGLMRLAGMPALKQLEVVHCKGVTPDGIARFRAARPDVTLRTRDDDRKPLLR